MKEIIRKFVKLLVSPIVLVFFILYKLKLAQYKTITIFISKIPGFIGNTLRQLFYEFTLDYVGNNLRVFYGSYIVYPNISIGNNCTIEEDCIISLCNIGDDVIIAANVSIMSGNKHHDVDDTINTFYNSKSIQKRVILGNNLWIGVRSVIMADISSHTAVGAGSVVTKTFPEYMVIAGIPAKVIKSRIN